MPKFFKTKIDFPNGKYVVRRFEAQDEINACWDAREMCEQLGGKSFDLMEV